jgi:hypothetical protein
MSYSLAYSGFELTNAKTNLGRLEQHFRLTFIVKSTSKVTMAEVAGYLWSTLPWSLVSWGYSTAILSTYNCRPQDEGGRTIWVGSADYTQSDYSSQQTTVDFSHNRYEELMVKARDENGNLVAVLNSAGEAFESPIPEVIQRQVIRISKCYPLTTSPAWFNQFRNSVNLNNIMVADIAIPRRAGRVLECVPVIQVISQVEYSWRFNVELEIKNSNEPTPTWDREVLDAGYSYLEETTVDGVPTSSDLLYKAAVPYRRVRPRVYDEETGASEPPDKPILLDGNGGRLADITPGNERYLTFRTLTEMPWESLGLPRTMWEALFVG